MRSEPVARGSVMYAKSILVKREEINTIHGCTTSNEGCRGKKWATKDGLLDKWAMKYE